MKLRLVVEHDAETKRWAAFFPELPGCASAGDTEEEAIRNAKEALELWFEPAPVNLSAGQRFWKSRSRERTLPGLYGQGSYSGFA